MPSFFTDRNNHRWLLQALGLLLLFTLLAWAVWLYFDWKMHEAMLQQLHM